MQRLTTYRKGVQMANNNVTLQKDNTEGIGKVKAAAGSGATVKPGPVLRKPDVKRISEPSNKGATAMKQPSAVKLTPAQEGKKTVKAKLTPTKPPKTEPAKEKDKDISDDLPIAPPKCVWAAALMAITLLLSLLSASVLYLNLQDRQTRSGINSMASGVDNVSLGSEAGKKVAAAARQIMTEADEKSKAAMTSANEIQAFINEE